MDLSRLGRIAPIEWNLFIVVLREPNQEIKTIIKENFSDRHYELAENSFLISSPGGVQEISMEIGLGDPSNDEAQGIVFKLNGSYSGRYYSAVWRWLYEAEKQRGEEAELELGR